MALEIIAKRRLRDCFGRLFCYFTCTLCLMMGAGCEKQNKVNDMWLFVGLGNPGQQYAGNRHNIGFMAVDAIAEKCGFSSFKSKFNGEIAEGTISGQKVYILKPQTYMNLSGESVAPAARFYKIPPHHIIVFHDELDLEAFKIKIKQGGGHAGHNGLKSIDLHLGVPDYWRVRLGIGHPGAKDRVHGYVLGNFAKEEQERVGLWMKSLADNASFLVKDRMNDVMTNVARDMKED